MVVPNGELARYIRSVCMLFNGDAIENITEDSFKGDNFKYEVCLDVLNKYKDKKVYGIGDSAVDIAMLSLTDVSFAIDPKGKLEKHVDYVIKDLREIIKYIDNKD